MLPMVVGEEIRVPLRLFESSTVNSPDPVVHTVHADLIRSQPNNGPMFPMSGIYALILFPAESHPQDPTGTKGRREVSTWNPG